MQNKINKEALLEHFKHLKSWLWQPQRRHYTVLGAAILFVFFLMLTKPSNQAQDRPEMSYPVEVLNVVPKPLSTTLYLYGMIESPTKSRIVSTVTTHVVATPVKEGAVISPGQLIIEMSAFEPQLITQQRIANSNEIEGMITAEKNRHAANLKAIGHEKALLALMQKSLERQNKHATQTINLAGCR